MTAELEENPRSKSAKLRIFEEIFQLKYRSWNGVDGKEQGSHKQKRQSKCKKCQRNVCWWKYGKETAGSSGDERRQLPGSSPEGRESKPKHAVLRGNTRPKHQWIRKTQTNSEKRLQWMGRGFVAFLGSCKCGSIILLCQLSSVEIRADGKMKTVASLESELAQLKEENDAYYSQVTSDVDLNKIKKSHRPSGNEISVWWSEEDLQCAK